MRRKRLWLLAAGLLLSAAVCAGAGYWVWATFIGPPPGVGPKAEQGYRDCAPVIDALGRFQAEHGAYPETLEELVPAFLPELPQSPGLEYAYRAQTPGYQLEFRYVGPGMNICRYTPEAGWDCEGYY